MNAARRHLPEPFAEIVRRHQAAVCAAAYGVTGDRALAEDVAQETFLAAWRGLPTLRDPEKLTGWLCGIARNLARKARRRRPAATLGLEDCAELAASDADDPVAGDDARVAWAALRELPPAYREALVLYYWEGQSARRVAEALGITEATAMQRLSRGRARLRAQLLRRVEGTLRRARPGAALTAAILAAVAARTAGTASAATASAAMAARLPAVSRRAIWKAGLTLVAARILGSEGAPIAALTRCPRTRPVRPASSLPATPRTDAARGHAPSAAATPGDALDAPSMSASRAGAPIAPDEANPYDESSSPSVTSSDGPADWANRLIPPLSLCFVDELVDHPCRIDVEIRGGQIVTATVQPFDGASRRVVVRTLQGAARALTPPELIAHLAANQLIHVVRDAPELADRDRAMHVGELVGLAARAGLEGLAVAGPDGVRQVRFGWIRDAPPPVDGQAYLDLDVAAGASRGPASAPVTVVSFLDIVGSWGFAGRSLAAWRDALARYPREVRLVVKLCPQCPDHELAAEAVYAAGAQGALWPMLELVAANPARHALDDLVGHATHLGLDGSRLHADLVQRSFRDAVELDRDQMTAMAIDGLPSALVNGTRFQGALPATACIDAVARALRRLARSRGTVSHG